jgi:hypothetical protein
MRDGKDQDKIEKISIVVQAIYAIIIGENISLIADPIIRILDIVFAFKIADNYSTLFLNISIILVTVINILIMIINWAAITNYKNSYNIKAFAVDLLTILVIYFLTYIVAKIYRREDGDNDKIVIQIYIIVSLVYLIIHYLFIKWNTILIAEGSKLSDFNRSHRKLIVLNGLLMIISVSNIINYPKDIINILLSILMLVILIFILIFWFPKLKKTINDKEKNTKVRRKL